MDIKLKNTNIIELIFVCEDYHLYRCPFQRIILICDLTPVVALCNSKVQ